MESDDNNILRPFSEGVSRTAGFRHPGEAVKRLLTISDAAALLGVKTQTLYVWVSQNRVPHRKIGRLVRFTEADLEEFVALQKHSPQDREDGDLPARGE
jgi:excisionase family DNA binding protein